MAVLEDDNSPIWFRILVALALLAGTGSGYMAVTKDDSDRYYASQALEDFRVVAIQLKGLERQLSNLKVRHEELAKDIPPQEVIKQLDRLENRIDYLTKRIQEESREAEEDLKEHSRRQHYIKN